MATISLCLFLLILGSHFSCQKKERTQNYDLLKLDYTGDPHTYARNENAVIEHMDLELLVDFKTKKLKGVVKYTILNNKSDKLILDSKDLDILKIYVGNEQRETGYTLSDPDPILGSALEIQIAPLTKIVEIHYETKAESAALQWLDAEQTGNKLHPFLYTQAQPILSRTWIPIQDSPGIRFTFEAKVQCPSNLLAVMSASNPTEKNAEGIYTFIQVNPVPAYLIALAVGDLYFEPLGARTGVYAEHNMIQKAKAEFSRTEEMLETAEKIYGPYLWGRYDILVLPPSFPFGGMENPMLTFATPTIIVGDQSLTSLVAHELAHSWSGNMVTNATWNDLWLNEGFTVYFERRIMETIYGKDFIDLLNVLTKENLQTLINRMGSDHPDTRLNLDLKDRDPDDGMTRIAYDKGYLLLLALENELGRPVLDSFMLKYFKDFQFKSIDSESFIEYIDQNLLIPHGSKFDIKEWIYLGGLPKNTPKFESIYAKRVNEALELFLKKKTVDKLDTKAWSAHEWRYFVSKIPRNTSPELLEQLNREYNLAFSGNAEIRAIWLELCIYAGYFDANYTSIENFLVTVGRRKFLVPLYQAMIQTDRTKEANMIYQKARPNYHAISRGTIDALLTL